MQIAPFHAEQTTTPLSHRFPRASAMDSQNGNSRNDFRLRKLSYQQGRALEMLGHAIEYLADEYAFECRRHREVDRAKAGPVQAIELLMARNREIYLASEPLPTLTERLLLWLGFARA